MKNLITKFFFICLITLISVQIFAQSISLVSESATSNQTLCINNPITEIKYLSAGGVTDVTVTGLPNGVTGTYNSGLYTINGTSTESGTFFYTITTVGGANAAVTEQGTLNIEGPATVTQGMNSNLCLNQNATVGDIAASPGTYLWTHDGTGTLANNTIINPVYTPAQGDVGKKVTLTLLVTSNNSCSTTTATTSFSYDVKDVPSFTGNLFTYVGATVQMNGSPGKNQNYPWMSSDGSIATIDNNGLITGVALGTTSITYYDENYCNVSKSFEVITLITPTISGNLTICSGSTSQLVGSENPMAENPWVSSNTSIATVSSTGLVLAISQGTVVITYTNSTGGSAAANVSINTTPTVSVNSSTICSGTSATLGATPSITGGTYLWGGNETTQNITVSPSTNTNYSVTYSYNGCTSIPANAIVTVNPIPSVSAGADITVCSGIAITLTGTGAQTYSWSNGVINGVSFTPVLGSTSYELTGTSNGCSATDFVVVTVNEKPNLIITNPVPVCEPATVDITTPAITSGSTGNGILTYWTDANCLNSLGSPNSIINAGPIFIKSTLGQCFDIKPITVSINKYPIITNPGNKTVCDSYSLTSITGTNLSGNEKYYDNSHANPRVQILGAITKNQTIWIYDDNNGCLNETSFQVTINVTPAITNPGNQTICDSYSLPPIVGTNLSGNEKYYDNSKANSGVQILGPISTNQTIWIYDDNNGCTNETSFQVAINKTPSITNPGNQTICDSLELPTISGINLSGNEKYYSNSKANNGVQITAPLKSNQTVWIYDESGSCSNEISFDIKIFKTPKLTSPGNQTVCDSYTLPSITGKNLTGHQKYYNKSQAENGIQITGPITTSQIIWIHDSIRACANEIGFEVTINPSPVLKITNPAQVDYPAKIDITLAGVTEGSTGNGTLTYWINPESSVELVNPTAISMSGTYFIKSTDGNCSDTNFVTVTINKKEIPTKLLSAYVIPTGVSKNGLCDGKAEVVITSGKAPYTYLFSDNSTISTALNLCPGLKSVRVTDENKDTLNLEFIISSPDNVTTTDNLKDSPIVDKLFNKVVSNCIIDYTKIASSKINKYKILSKDSIEIEWKIYSGSSEITVTNKYSIQVISTSGVYQFSLQIYCPNKTMGNFLTAYDQLYINVEEIDITSGLGIQEKSINEYSIYPNPFNDYIIIELDNQKVSEISITDNTGKIMKSLTSNESEVTIKTDDLLPGFYILKIKNGNSIKSIKLSK